MGKNIVKKSMTTKVVTGSFAGVALLALFIFWPWLSKAPKKGY